MQVTTKVASTLHPVCCVHTSHLALESDCPGNSRIKQSSIHTTPKLCLVKYKCKTRGWKSCHHPFMGMSMVDHALIHPVPAPPSAIVVFTSLLQSGIILELVSPSVPSLSLCFSLFVVAGKRGVRGANMERDSWQAEWKRGGSGSMVVCWQISPSKGI